MGESIQYCLAGIQTLCLPSSDWAAWVQAVGSVIAIVASAAFVMWQHHLQEKAHRLREVQSRLDEVQAMVLLVEHVIDLANTYISQLLAGNLIAEVDFDAIVLSHASLRDMSNSEAPTPDLVAALIMARHGAEHAFNAALILYGRLKFGDIHEGDAQAMYDGALARLRKSLATFRQRKAILESELSKSTGTNISQ